MKKPVFGVGVNDVDYEVNPKGVICPFYSTWKSMLNRCYNKTYQNEQPTYIGCIVCEEWLSFSKFKSWMITKNWKNKELDKDLLEPGNKVYSPQTCTFLSREINVLFIHKRSNKGKYPTGVNVKGGKFSARVNIHGERCWLGCFETPGEAQIVYEKAKIKHCFELALTEEPEIANAIRRYCKSFEFYNLSSEQSIDDNGCLLTTQ